MPQNDLQVLYQAASKKFNVGTYENFEAGMRDPKKRKSFYNAASKQFKLSSYENFSAKIDSLTSIPGEKPGEDARITSTPASPKEEKLTGDTTGKYSWGRATSVIDPKTGTRKEPEWRSGSRPVTDYATVDKEPVTSDAIWKTGLNAIGAKDPDQYDFINRRMELGSHQLNEFTKFKVEKEGVQVNAQKISGLLNKAKEDADKASRFYEEAFSKIEKQLEVAKAANDVEWQNKLIAAANMVIDQQKADPVFKTYNDLVTKYNELSKYEKDLPAKYPMVKEQQAEVQKVNDEYKDGGFWTKAYFQTAYPAMGAFNEISKSIMGASDHLANLTGLMSNDELRDYTEYKKGTIAMPAPDQTELFNPSSGKFQAAGILPTMFKVGLQSYGFYKGGAIINQTGIPMGASQWLSVFTQTYPMFYEQGIESGLSTKEAQTYAALSSGTEAMIERILPEEKIFGQMLPNITKVYKGVKALDGNMPTKIAEFTKGYLRVAIPEVTEEVLADVAQNIYQNTANDMVQSSFDVKPLTMQEEAKTIVTTAIGMAPMSLMGGYNRVKNITKVARYEAGLAPKSYIEFAEKQFAKKAITQKAYDNIVKTANSMAEIIDQIPDVTASGRKMTKEKKIELANLLYEQKLLAEKKAASPPLFQAAFDEAAADLEERMNKAYGLKVEENEMEEEDDIIEYAQLPKAAQEAADRYRDALEGKDVDKSLPTLEQLGFEIHEDMDSEMGEGTVYFRKIEPVAATEEQTEELDEETAAEIEGLKGDIAAGAGGPTVSKIETVGDKEFYSHEDNEYEVKSGADGSIEFINSTSGQVINRKSTNYDAVAAGYIMEKFADAPDTESNAPDAQGYYMDVAAKSTNPLEILVAASSVDEMEGESDRASAKDKFLGQNSFITFTEEDARRKFGFGLSDMANWQALRDNYYQKKGKVSIVDAANDANRQFQDNWEGRSDESITEDDLWDFIERFPYGYDESQMMGPLTKSLADRFTTVTGIPMDRQMLEAFRDLRTKANSIAKKDQDAMFDWFAEHPGGTIEELQQDVELTEETKTILDETESTPFPWETEESQEAAAGSSEAGDDAVKDETQRQEEKQPEIISQSIVVTPDKIVGGDAAFGDQVELIDGTKGRVTSVTETQVGRGKNAKWEKKVRVTLDKGSTDVAPVEADQPEKDQPKEEESKKRVQSKKEFDKISGVKTTLVGSTARGEARVGSDIDIVLEGMPHQNKDRLNSEERQENSNYAYDTLKHLAENGTLTEFELLPNGFGLSFKFNGHTFQVVPNPKAPKQSLKDQPTNEKSDLQINFQKGASYTDPQGNGITIIGNKGEKEGYWAIFYKGKSSVRSEADITNLIRNGEAAAPVKTELDAEIDNFTELFNKIKKKRNNPGIINDPQQDAEDDLELISAGAKLVKVAMKTGLHKFADIVAYAAKRIGDTINELLPYMQKAYTSLLGDTSISEADLDKMDDPKIVRNFKLPVTNETESTISRDTTSPDNGSGNIPELSPVQQSSLFDGTVQQPKTKKGTAGSSQPGADNKRPVGKGRQEQPGSTGSDQPGDTVPEVPKASDERTDDPNIGTNNEENPKPPRSVIEPDARNFVITPETVIVPAGELGKIKGNIAAIKLLKQLESENRKATPAEKEVLAQFVGWGGVSTVLSVGKSNEPGPTPWKTKYLKYHQDLKAILTPDEWNAAVGSTTNAHYTDRAVIQQLWSIAQQMGFVGGKVLESSAGIGHIMGLMPASLQPAVNASMVELDSISGRIMKMLYPENSTQVIGFEEAKLNPASYDLAITNVPFGQHAPFDKVHSDIAKFSLHNYFMAKNMRMVKPGGLGVFISTWRSMDHSASTEWRKYMEGHEDVDFIGAIKLPNSAQDANAGTQITTDIIIFQKRLQPGKKSPLAQPWINDVVHRTAEGKEGGEVEITINEYYKEHPEMMLGDYELAYIAGSGGLYGADEQTLVPRRGIPIAEQIEAAAKNLPSNITSYTPSTEDTTQFSDEGDEDGTYVTNDKGEVFFVENGERVTVPFANEKVRVKGRDVSVSIIIKMFVDLKAQVKSLVSAERSTEATESDIEERRAKLRRLYTSFIERYGVFNRNSNISFLMDDNESMLVYALETLKSKFVADKAGRIRTKVEVYPSDILYKRVNHPYVIPDKAENITDAVNLSLVFHGNIDLDYISSLLGDIKREDAARLTLENGLGYEDPQTGEIIEKDIYLSGNVREKLKAAEAAKQSNPRFEANYEALKAVQPTDIPMRLIAPALGAGWIPIEIYERFFAEILGRETKINYNPKMSRNQWSFGGVSTRRNENRTVDTAAATWGILGYDGATLAGYAMNLTDVVVRDPDPVNKGKYIKNAKKTEDVNNKIDDIRAEFVRFLKETDDLHEAVEKQFNETQNSYVEYKNSRSIKRFPGQSEFIDGKEFALREHQSKAVLRILRQSTLLAHGVGSGKTYTIITAAMEMKRLKLANKPMIVAWNETLEQFTESARKLYPAAKILSPTANQMDAKNRQRLIASMVYGNWDMIIIPHSFMKFIPNDPEREIAYLRQRIAELEETKDGAEVYVIEDINKEIEAIEEMIVKKSTKKVKDVAKSLQGVTKRVKKQLSARRDQTFLFEESGIDALFIDEADAFKKIGFTTSQRGVRGIDVTGSQKALDAYMKAQWVRENNAGRNVVLATGTPVTNTIAEIWTMMRYVAPETLADLGIETFDQFATSFANIDKTVEMTAGNTFKEISRLKTYKNAPALISAFRNNADVVLSSEVKEFQQDNTLPKVQGGEAEKVIIDMSKPLEKVMEGIKQTYEWWENLKGKEKKANKHVPLVLYGLAKKAAVDLRLLNTSSKRYEDDPNSKLNQTVKIAYDIYKKNDDIKGMQLIFCDSIKAKDESFNAHQEMKKKLMAMGVPESEIVIADDKFKGNRRMKAMQDANDGIVRFMIGHTDRLGVGLNVQTRCVALIHVDAPPRPRDYEQRNGRIIRQGNLCAVPVSMGGFEREVRVINMGVKNTLDRLAYERLQFKQFFINQILSGKVEWGEMEDPTEEINPSDLQHGAMGALLGGSQTGIKVNELRRQLRKIESAYDNFNLKLRNLTTRRNQLRTLVPYWRDVRKAALDAFIKDIPNYTNETGQVNRVVINGADFSSEVKPLTVDEATTILNDTYQGWEKYPQFPSVIVEQTGPSANWTTTISNFIAQYGGPAETVKLIDALKARLNSKLGTAIENAVAEGRNKATTENRDYTKPVKTVIKIGDSFVATVSSYETKILDKEDAKRYNAAMGAKVVTSDLSLYETLNDKAFNYQYANSSSIIQRIYPEITTAKKENNEIDQNIEKGEQELKDIDIELKKPFIGMDDMTKIRGKINELQLELIAESNAKPDKEVVLTEDAQAILDGVKKDIEEAVTNDDETEPTEEDEDPDDDFTPSDNEVNEPPSDALYNAQKKIEDKLDQLDKGLDDAFKDISGAYILPPKPILKAALKIIRYSVKAGFSIARAFRNGYRYIQTTDWYRERVAQKNPYDLADLQQMLTDYGVTQATDLDSLDKYLKRIRKFVNGATPAELESALNNLTNFITQRVKSIGLSDTRLFLDAIDKIRKSQGNPARLATAIVNFEKAVDQFIYREQYRDAIRAKREARRNLVKGQKFPDIRLLGMELVNLPIVKNREKIPIELLWKYLEAINPLAVKGKELIPNVRKITEVIREVADWANSIADREEADRGARDTTDADARKEQQMDQWRQDIDRMKASFDPASIVRAPEIDGDLQQMIREFVALDHNALEYAALKNYWGIMVNLSENKLVSPNIYNDWVLPKRKQVKVDSVSTMAREVQFYFDNIRELVNKLRNVPKTLWDAKLLRPDPALRYDAPFWNNFIQPLVKAIEKFRIDYQTVAGGLEKLYQKLGKHSLDRAKAAMEVRMWAFANQVDHNRPDIDFKKKLNQSLANMSQDPLYSDIYKDYLDAYNSLLFAPQEGNEPRLIDLQATFDAFTPAQKAFAQGLASLVSERLQPIVQYQQMYVRGENVNFIEGYHPMAVLGGVNVEEATTESQVEALLSNTGMRGTMLSTKAGSMFARTYPNKVFYSFSYPSLLDSIEGTFFDKHLTEPVKEVFGAMISGDFTTAFTSSLASEMRKQMMSMLKHEIGFNEQTKSIEQRLIDSLIRALTGRALVSIKRFAEAIPNWSVAAPHISDNPYDAVKTIYNSSRNFFDHPREWLEMMRDNGFSVYMRFSTHSEMIDTPGGKSIIIHNPFLNPLKHLRESKVVRKIYDQQNKTKFEQLASDVMTAVANNNVSRMGVLIQQMSIGIGDYVSSFPIWVASFNQHLTKHGHPEWVPGGDNSAIPQEAITAAGNFAENVVDRSVGTSNRGRSAEKTYSFTSEDERKRWYAYALGRFNWFLGVLMFQQTAYFRHHAANLIKGGGEYGRLRSAGVLAGLIAGNVAFNLTTKIIGAIIIGLGGDDEAKKKQLADLGTKEYWARNLGSALLQLTLLGKLPYFSKIIMSMGVEALNKYITEEVMDQSYNSYHDALVYSPRLPLPTEWAQSKQVYNAFMPFMSPVQSIYEPIIAGTDMVANGNPTDDALVKFNMMKAALAITNLAITIPFVNKEVYGVLNAAGMPVKASDYDNLRDIKKERTDLKDAAKKEFDSNYAAMDPEIAKERLDSLILEAPNTVESERLQSVKKMLTQPKYDQMTAFDKFLHSYPAAAKAERIKQDLNTMPSEQIKEKLEYYRNLGVISQNIYQELMDEMYLSQHLDQMTPQQRREHRYRMEQRKSK